MIIEKVTGVSCTRLSLYVTDSLWHWLKCYLVGRSQLVSINGATSSILPVTSGIPQGSILGPLLFLIYVNDLPASVTTSFPLLFADDCKCLSSTSISASADGLLMQKDLDSLQRWSSEWSLPLSVKSCTSILLISLPLTFRRYTINGSPIDCVSHLRDLGIIFSNDLSWSSHYDHIPLMHIRLSIYSVVPYRLVTCLLLNSLSTSHL